MSDLTHHEVLVVLTADTMSAITLPNAAPRSLGLTIHNQRFTMIVEGEALDGRWLSRMNMLVGSGPQRVRETYPDGTTVNMRADSTGIVVTFHSPPSESPIFDALESTDRVSGSVERRLTEADLEGGRIRFGGKEATRLGLPHHSSEIDLLVGAENIFVSWDPRARELGGEALAELLADEAHVGQLARLHRSIDRVELELVPEALSAINLAGRRRAEVVPRDELPAAPRRRSANARGDRYRIRARDEHEWFGNVGLHRASLAQLRDAVVNDGWDTREGFELRLRGERLAAISGFDELLAVDLAKVDQMAHQQAAAMKVLAEMNGRAILADEVGLGKTIEAGLIASELTLRGMVRRILVICPAGLREQWQEELAEKFGIESTVMLKGTDSCSTGNVITSVHLARNNGHKLAAQDWDLVIVDEAHRAGGKKTQAMLRQLSSRYLLYLTATPVQNSLDELYKLVESLRPGTFRSLADFHQRFCSGGDRRTPTDPEGLRRLVRDVMVRTTRAQAGLDRVQRYVNDVPVELSPQERDDYDRLLAILRAHFTSAGDHFRRQSLAQRLAASPRALAVSLLKLVGNELPAHAAAELEEIANRAIVSERTNRQQCFIDQVLAWTQDPSKGKVLVFTQHTEVAEDLLRQLDAEGIAAVAYHGRISSTKKREAIETFRTSVPVMVSTESGAEGLNLQFCNCVLNYDLPWNPMRIEQRIGRVHRVTQRRDVYVANLFAVGTVEDRVYELLREKLKMFELLFGQITLILGEIGDEAGGTIEKQIAAAIFDPTDASANKRFDKLGAEFSRASAAAATEIAASSSLSYLSNWDTSYRDGLTREGASELKPDDVIVARDRRAEVVTFVNDLLKFVGADVERSSERAIGDGEEQEIFLSARLPDHEQRYFGGVDRLHIAFHPAGLSLHRDAELCAVGSDLFDEFVQILRPRGDLLIEVPRVELQEDPLYEATEDLTYVGRSLLGPTEWATHATWRVRLEGDGSGESIVSTTTGDLWAESELDVLTDEFTCPDTLDIDELLPEIKMGAIEPIEAIVTQALAQASAAQERDRERMAENYDAQIAELSNQLRYNFSDDVPAIEGRLKQFRDLRESMSSTAKLNVEARGDLLALRLTGGPEVIVRERWTTADGDEVVADMFVDVRTGECWAALGDDGEPLETVARCSSGHVVDQAGLSTCEECSTVDCGACPGHGSGAVCPGCLRAVCGHCLSDDLCRQCAAPVRDPDRDSLGLQAFIVGGHHQLLVGRTAAYRDGEPIVGAHHLHDGVAELACQHGAAVDAGLSLDPLVLPDSGDDLVRVPLGSALEHVVITSNGNGTIEPDALAVLGLGPMPPAHRRVRRPLVELIQTLRANYPTEADQLVVREIGIITRLRLGPHEPTIESYLRDETGTLERIDEAITWNQVDNMAVEGGFEVATAVARGRTLHLIRIYTSYLLVVGEGKSQIRFFIPGPNASDYASERQLAEIAERLGFAGAILGRVAGGDCPEPVETIGAIVTERSVEPYDSLSDRLVIEPLQLSDLQAPGRLSRAKAPDTIPGLTHWATQEDESTGGPLLGVGTRYKVVELWQGDGTFEHAYEVEAGDTAISPVPGADWFTIDRSGHPIATDQLETCEVCASSTCQQCAPDIRPGPCPVCTQAACGECRPREAAGTWDGEDIAACGTCDRRLCPACGRGDRAMPCAVCLEPTCHLCLLDGFCPSCADLHIASIDERKRLPSDLAITGHLVLVGAPTLQQVVVIAGGLRRELVILDHDALIIRWSSARNHADALERLLLKTSRGGPVSEVIIEELTAEPAVQGLLLADQRTTLASARRSGVPIVAERLIAANSGVEGLVDELMTGDSGIHRPVHPLFEKRLESRIETLLAGHEVPPGTPLTISVVEVAEWVELDRTGLVEATCRKETIERRPIELSSEAGSSTLQGLAGTRGQWTLSVAPFGDTCRLTVLSDSTSSEWVVVPDDDEWPTRHVLLDKLRADLHLSAGVRLTAGDLGEPLPPPSVEGVEVVHREHVSHLAVAVNAEATDNDLPNETLQRFVDTPPGHQPRVLQLPFPIPSSLTAIPRPRVAVSRWHLCSDTWRGDAEHTLDYEVEGSSALPPPRLDDTGEASWTFAIDRAGHLAAPDRIVPCQVCGGSTCAACGPDQGIGECSDCHQPSCGSCRPERGTLGSALRSSKGSHRDDQCGVCGSILCDSCGRKEIASHCTICERPTCHRCSEAGTCATCRSIRPVTEAEQLNLPAVLRASGLQVGIGADGRNQLITLAGGMRQELALLSGNSVVSWWDLRRLPSVEWRLAAGAIAGPVSEIVTRRSSSAASATPPDLILADDHIPFVGLLHVDEREALPAVRVPPGTDPLVAIANSLPIAELPQPASTQHIAAASHLFGDSPAGEPVVLDVFDVVDRIEITDSGLVRSTGRASRPSQTHLGFQRSQWQAIGSMPIEFDSVDVARCGDYSVAKASLGPIHYLVIDRPKAPAQWWRVDQSNVDPGRVLLGRLLLGQSVDVRVSAATFADEYEPLTVLNARFGGRQQRMVATIDHKMPPNEVVTARCLSLISEVPSVLRSSPRPDWARQVDPPNSAPGPEATVVRVDLAVSEVWYVDGQGLQLDYTVKGPYATNLGRRGRMLVTC